MDELGQLIIFVDLRQLVISNLSFTCMIKSKIMLYSLNQNIYLIRHKEKDNSLAAGKVTGTL